MEPGTDTPVALVAGATRGAGRAIAVELARAGFFTYATGRSSRVSGQSEIGRPETIEETGDLIGAAGGAGTQTALPTSTGASRTAGATWPPTAGSARTARASTTSAELTIQASATGDG
jgi:NAD(P)-dependent dehydrogenase (short-subunit alcohol dehydrogenase family)